MARLIAEIEPVVASALTGGPMFKDGKLREAADLIAQYRKEFHPHQGLNPMSPTTDPICDNCGNHYSNHWSGQNLCPGLNGERAFRSRVTAYPYRGQIEAGPAAPSAEAHRPSERCPR